MECFVEVRKKYDDVVVYLFERAQDELGEEGRRGFVFDYNGKVKLGEWVPPHGELPETLILSKEQFEALASGIESHYNGRMLR